ncbi:MAG: InlB B-repeat-containing protein [Bacilli bacterium]|nr:InlB B-repeat-containing protein [Bacilli bacterium]
MIFEVVFVDFDGTINEKCIVNKNESATAPKNPSREGYDFTGCSTY